MLNQFIFQNYRIFQNETLLDFFPAPINEHKTLSSDRSGGSGNLPPRDRSVWAKWLWEVLCPGSTLGTVPIYGQGLLSHSLQLPQQLPSGSGSSKKANFL